MNKYILTILFCFSVLSVFSQYKGSVNKARSYLTKLELTTDQSEINNFLKDAKGEVDAAIKIEKNIQKADIWLTRGDVYAEIAKLYPELDNDAIDKALESYNKIGFEIETKNLSNISNANVGKQNLSTFFINQAITSLQGSNEPNYEQAYTSFSNSLKVNPNDTLGLLYGGFVAEQLSMFTEALDFYDKLMKMKALNDKNTNTIYQNSVNIYYSNCEEFDECGSFDNSIRLINEAKELFPENNYYPSVEINIAMRLNKVEEARGKIDNQLSMDPENANLHFNRAVLYYNLGLALTENNGFNESQKLDTLDKVFKTAIESYKSTLQFDPSNERALLYMLDAYKANAKPYYDLERNLDFLALKNKYQSESDRLKNEGNSRISEGQVYAIDYLNLKGEDINNDDIATIYPIFSIMEDYENLIKVLSVSVNRDNTNAEYLEVLRNAYMKIKNYEKAEDIYQMILKLQ
ncbi:MAG: tetratricopeptide repeat protein [Cytophagales bacterium]